MSRILKSNELQRSANLPTHPRTKSGAPAIGRSKWADALLNTALIATVGLTVAVYTLPIFSHELFAPAHTYDFGTVKAGTLVRHTFTLRNLHPWAVTVTGLQSDCGCTKSVVGRELPFRLAPLETVKVAASVDMHSWIGSFSHSISVATSDNSSGTSLTLKGRVYGNSFHTPLR